jgi:hypothetical protein
VTTFTKIARYDDPNYLPGAVSCLGTFCMRLDFGNGWGLAEGFSATDSVSSDSGSTWRVRGNFPVAGSVYSLTLMAVFSTLDCISARVCYAKEDGYVAVTTNAGSTWTEIARPAGQSVIGFACLGVIGCVVVTDDTASGSGLVTYWLPVGSTSLEKTSASLADLYALTIVCTGTTKCVLAGGGSSGPGGDVYVTSNPGPSMSWTQTATSASTAINNLACPSTTECVAVETVTSGANVNTELARSTDAGASFSSEADLGSALNATRTTIACGDPTSCVATYLDLNPPQGNPSFLADTYVSTNGGASWTSTMNVNPTTTPAPFVENVSCSAPANCVLDIGAVGPGSSGVGGLSEHTTNLETWSLDASPYNPTGILSVACTTTSTCYEVISRPSPSAFSSELLVTRNDGASWSPVAVPVGDEPVLIGGCQAAPTCEVIAVSGESLLGDLFPVPDFTTPTTVVLTTTDAGAHWKSAKASSRGFEPLQATCGAVAQCSILLFDGRTENEYLASTSDMTHWTRFWVEALVPPSHGGLNLDNNEEPESCVPGAFCLFAGQFIKSSDPTESIYASHDGGAMFTRVTLPAQSLTALAVSCSRARVCNLLYQRLGDPGVIFDSATTNGGRTWSAPIKMSPPAISVALSCTGLVTCVATFGSFGQTSVRTTDNSGRSWSVGRWAGPVLSGKHVGVSLFGPMSCSATVCLTYDQAVPVASPLGAWDDLDRALR